MNKKKFFLNQIAVCLVLITGFIACEKDFVDLNSDLINGGNATNFDITSQKFDVLTNTKALGAVQTNGLSVYGLGVYNDAFGQTTSSILTQLSPETLDPDFGDGTVLDSVVLTIPYFATITDADDEGNFEYELDSVIGDDKFKINLFRSNFFLRNFDPSGEFNETQTYFSDKTASANEDISDAVLESTPLDYYYIDEDEDDPIITNNIIKIKNQSVILTALDDEGEEQITARLSPRIRLHLDIPYWFTEIIDLDEDENLVLSSANNFFDYFRGLYLQAEPVTGSNSHVLFNLASTDANITLYYKRTETDDDGIESEINETYVLNFADTSINFFENDFTGIPLVDGTDSQGDSRLHLKGGQGALASVKLFNGDDIDDDADTTFEDFKNTFVETNEDGEFVKSKRLINEANLIFNVDQDAMIGVDVENYPTRVYLYDLDNQRPLLDYFLDASSTTFPELSISSHLGPLDKVETENGSEVYRYKFRITEHINNLLLRDSTNINLGLAVSLNVNQEEVEFQREVRGSTLDEAFAPSSSVNSPRGVVLFGNNPESQNEDKKVQLEIYYTCLDGDDCDQN